MKFFCFCFFVVIEFSAQETTVMRHCDHFQTFQGQESVVKLVPNKVKRLNNSLGCLITPTYDFNLSDEMKFCIKAATELWAEQLSLEKPISLLFKKESMGSDKQDIITDVYYYTSVITKNRCYAHAYAINIGELIKPNAPLGYDAVITINEDVNWSYDFSDSIDISKKNFTTAILRSIAISLGFSSTVTDNQTKGIIFHNRFCFSPFDNLVVNSNNVLLNAMPNTGRADERLTTYVTGDNVYFKNRGNEDFKLYSPLTFEEYNSLVFFKNKGSLMSHTIQAGDKFLYIDDRTLEVIRLLGWKAQERDINIIGSGIDSTGIVSSFKSYQFHAESTSGTISNYSWTYELLDKDKKYVTVKKENTPFFSIEPIVDETLYYKNIEGDMQGRITLEAIIQGRIYKKYFNLYLEKKPAFISVKIDAINPDADGDFYDLDVTVIYNGADRLYFEFEQEFSSTVWVDFIREPYLTHLHFDGVYMRGMAWLDLEIANKYGTTTYAIELPRQNTNSISQRLSDNRLKDFNKKNGIEYLVYNIQGQQVLQTKEYRNVELLPKSVYILKTKKNDGSVHTNKILIK